MSKIQTLLGFRQIIISTSPARCFSKSSVFQLKFSQFLSPKTNLGANANRKKISPTAYLLLVIPAGAFALGTWQIARKRQKEALIDDLKILTTQEPLDLPDSLDELKTLEYRPLRVRGEFLHDKELYMGPRALLVEKDTASMSTMISGAAESHTKQGYLVITPFKLADRDETILVNRGWVSTKEKNPAKRKEGQVEGVIDLVGVVRLTEDKPLWSPPNDVNRNNWFYRDIEKMAKVTGASPIYLDASDSSVDPKGPVGGQTRISLRNEHLSYIVTWYSLCIVTSFLWFQKFIRG